MPRSLWQPVRVVPLAYLGAIVLGTLLLLLPVCRRDPGDVSLVVALFTAASAVCVSGLTVVDTPGYWSGPGLVVITLLTQLGGLGIMTLATLLSLLVSERLGLRSRLIVQSETHAFALGNVRRVLVRITAISLVFETVVTLLLAARFWLGYDHPPFQALWYGLFHAVQAFNNCGFSLFRTSMIQFVGDWWICLPLIAAVIAGSLGFPVLLELARNLQRPFRWSTHTRLTVWGSLTLLVFGLPYLILFEWTNPHTLGPLGVQEKILASLFQNVMARSGGLVSVDLTALRSETVTMLTGMMFIGGGSASTAGGIKVTTFFLLAFVIWAEIRGEPDVVIAERRMAESTQRVAVTVALLGVAVVAAGALLLVMLSDGVAFYRALFEAASAFGTAGLTVLPTSHLPAPAQMVLVGLMFLGRVGVVTVAAGLALNTRPRYYRYPEERPIVG